MRINWGTKIMLAFICFAGLIATMITICIKQDISLVAKDYYTQEIAYQDQIDRIKNAQALGDRQPDIAYENGELAITVPHGKVITGEVHFFRPSNAALDKKYVLKVNARGHQAFDMSGFQKGLWKIKINWQEGGVEYYKEKTVVI